MLAYILTTWVTESVNRVPQVYVEDPSLSWTVVTDVDAGGLAVVQTMTDLATLARLDKDGNIVLLADAPGWQSDEAPDVAWTARLRKQLADHGVNLAVPDADSRWNIAATIIARLGGKVRSTTPPPQRGGPAAVVLTAQELDAVHLAVALTDIGRTPRRSAAGISEVLDVCQRCPDEKFNGRHCVCVRIDASEQRWMRLVANANAQCPLSHWG